MNEDARYCLGQVHQAARWAWEDPDVVECNPEVDDSDKKPVNHDIL